MAHNPYSDPSASSLLSSSISSLSNSRHQSSQIAKTYRQAAQLFLTRRLPEALSTIEPIITPPTRLPYPTDGQDDQTDGEEQPAPAPIAAASRGTRVKVWSFYLTFLNAVVELGSEEGKHAFGAAKWKALVAKTRDGSIWEEVVRDGYGGSESDVDAEVVINLATLLLTHSPDQRLNQQRLETYLSATAHPTFAIDDSSLYKERHAERNGNGTATPRDLNSRLKLLELYTLHVLPRNEEWEYAREFISMSEVLDDERKDAFLLALHGLRAEKDNAAEREAELRKRQEEELQLRRRQSEERRAAAEDERKRRDEESKRAAKSPPAPTSLPRSEDGRPKTANGGRQQTPSNKPSAPAKKKATTPPPGFYQRASSALSNMQILLRSTAQSMTASPMAMLRTLLFLMVFFLAFGRRDLRERIRRLMRQMWEKVRRTVGMGVKVSYI
ncbi:hypothetical protein H2201_002818 [Coniosporium apollinis]|uniref:Peroxin 26 n=1 Tax=Coniosporium apollinis TaxID=61459 RepID=A0ABQ9P086_9PEZI|nr:hypothetical protein H2201_002818 [Coniosporium apollinis]